MKITILIFLFIVNASGSLHSVCENNNGIWKWNGSINRWECKGFDITPYKSKNVLKKEKLEDAKKLEVKIKRNKHSYGGITMYSSTINDSLFKFDILELHQRRITKAIGGMKGYVHVNKYDEIIMIRLQGRFSLDEAFAIKQKFHKKYNLISSKKDINNNKIEITTFQDGEDVKIIMKTYRTKEIIGMEISYNSKEFIDYELRKVKEKVKELDNKRKNKFKELDLL